VTFWQLFMYIPLGVFVLTYFLFVRRVGLRFPARLVWTLWLLFGFSKFCFFKWYGGHAFNPEFPQLLLWFWDWAYSGCMILAFLSVVCCFQFKHKAWVLPALAWGLSAWGLWNGVKPPAIREFELTYADLPAELDGYRVVQLSDLHCSSGARRWRTEKVVDLANAQRADLLCLTGDYADGYVSNRLDDISPIERLHAKDGVFAVTGNHEYYWNFRAWQANFYSKLPNVRFLANDCAVPRAGLAVGGVPDIVGSRKYKDLAPDIRRAFASAPKDAFRILLQHQPKGAAVYARECGVRLQLSGHTHGGITPLFRPIIASHNDGFVHGLYRLGESYLYVCPGCGQWEGFPMRFFNESEITVITLRRESK